MKPGDFVICINSEETCQLQEGKVYQIKGVSWKKWHNDRRKAKYAYIVGISEDEWSSVCYHVSHFKKRVIK